MTYLDKVIKEHADDVKEIFIRQKCPSNYGLSEYAYCNHGGNCTECWNREVEE